MYIFHLDGLLSDSISQFICTARHYGHRPLDCTALPEKFAHHDTHYTTVNGFCHGRDTLSAEKGLDTTSIGHYKSVNENKV